MSKRALSFLALMGCTSLIQADDNVVRLLAKTNSTSTLVVNKGLLDGLRPQDRGSFIMLLKDDKELNLGSAEAVKVFNGYSVWALKNRPAVEIAENQKLILREMGAFYNHKPEPKVRRQRIIGPRRNVENSLTKNSSRFEKGLTVEESNAQEAVEKVLLDKSEWAERESYNDEKQAVPHEISPNISSEEFKQGLKEKRFDDVVQGGVTEQNTNPVQVERLFRLDKLMSSDESTYHALIDDRYQRKVRAEEAVIQQEKKGQAWSDDMSDRELINFVQKNGIAHEQERRLYLMHKQYSMEATLAMGFKINDSSTTADTTTTNELTRDFGMALEYFLGTRYQKFDHFSLEGEYRKAESIAAAGTYNARVNSTTLGASAYWYPFTFPTELAKNLFFVGLGFKKGSSQLTTARVSQAYAVTVFPVVSAGIRYHFEKGFGLRLMTSMESLSLTPKDPTLQTVDTLPSTVSFYDMKIIGGISYYF